MHARKNQIGKPSTSTSNLKDLFHNNKTNNRLFLENIHSFNMMFSFTLLGGKIDVSKNDKKCTSYAYHEW